MQFPPKSESKRTPFMRRAVRASKQLFESTLDSRFRGNDVLGSTSRDAGRDMEPTSAMPASKMYSLHNYQRSHRISCFAAFE
jgi:hypothetical protein